MNGQRKVSRLVGWEFGGKNGTAGKQRVLCCYYSWVVFPQGRDREDRSVANRETGN